MRLYNFFKLGFRPKYKIYRIKKLKKKTIITFLYVSLIYISSFIFMLKVFLILFLLNKSIKYIFKILGIYIYLNLRELNYKTNGCFYNFLKSKDLNKLLIKKKQIFKKKNNYTYKNRDKTILEKFSIDWYQKKIYIYIYITYVKMQKFFSYIRVLSPTLIKDFWL